MNTILRMSLTSVLLVVAGFCVYGILACLEPPVLTELITLYAVTGVCSMAAAIGMAYWGRRRTAIA